MATVIQRQPRNQALLNALGAGAQNFVQGRIQAGQQQAQRQDLVGLSQAIQQGQQGGNLAQILGNFQPQTVQGAQAVFDLTSQLAGSQGDPFTLSQGQTRFGASGQPIANVPAQQTPVRGVSVSPGQQLVDPITGRLIATGPAQAPRRETVGDIRAEEIRRIQAIPAKTRTSNQNKRLTKLIEGQAGVSITFGKPASAAERTAIAETEATLDSLNNLETLFNSDGVNTGPIAGRVSQAVGAFGFTSQNQEEFLAATAAFKNSVIKEITGAQMSEQEATRILKQVPTEDDPPARWRAKFKQTKRNLQELQKRRSEVLKKSGIVSPLGDGISDAQLSNDEKPKVIRLRELGVSEEEIQQAIIESRG